MPSTSLASIVYIAVPLNAPVVEAGRRGEVVLAVTLEVGLGVAVGDGLGFSGDALSLYAVSTYS